MVKNYRFIQEKIPELLTEITELLNYVLESLYGYVLELPRDKAVEYLLTPVAMHICFPREVCSFTLLC
ncbi:MAG: hypothetical protein DRJ40_10915 [Thermoprotei archaeon]|nr:MAG: hypothetical protein DRJ40_10915 [Thermoprotei archaeon]